MELRPTSICEVTQFNIELRKIRQLKMVPLWTRTLDEVQLRKYFHLLIQQPRRDLGKELLVDTDHSGQKGDGPAVIHSVSKRTAICVIANANKKLVVYHAGVLE